MSRRSKKIQKWGKTITYSVDGITGSWMLVTDGDQSWLHTTKNGIPNVIPNIDGIYWVDVSTYDTQLTQNQVKRKDMWELLVHFGAEKQDLRNVWKKKLY